VQHHGATLGKTGQENPRQVDALGLLGLDQRDDLLGRFLQLRFVDARAGSWP
jgi:hypothetical protein